MLRHSTSKEGKKTLHDNFANRVTQDKLRNATEYAHDQKGTICTNENKSKHSCSRYSASSRVTNI